MTQRNETLSPRFADKEEGEGGGKHWLLENLRKTRTIELFGGVNNAVAKKVITALLFLEADDPDQPIIMLQNSPGGSVTDGMAIYDTMRFVKPDVKVLCVGLTASIATITLLGAKKEHRLSLPHTEFLIHQPLIAGNIYGQASDLEITAREMLKTRARINKMLAEETGQPIETIQKHTQRDYWMSADEAQEYGLISKVIQSRAELDAV
ncbi:MAG: ATP-dependent Clp protease protease subunit [Myxococcota bacterium]|jgi:ATP-dependent Clp protease protease subunit